MDRGNLDARIELKPLLNLVARSICIGNNADLLAGQ
jgi:hypothetical protein